MIAAARPPFLEALKSGAFLDRARIRRIAVIYFLASLASFAVLVATSDGFRDRLGRPLGTDFMAFHVAGSVALEDGGVAAFDGEKQYARHQQMLGEEQPSFWPYLYPPSFLFIAMALASLPYVASWLVWMGATLSAYVVAMQQIAPGRFAGFLAIACPAVYLNFLHGQNGFLIAALFAGALASLSARRAILAGVLFGLVSIKPQYGLLIPVALAAAGCWRAFAAAAVTVIALIAAPTIAFTPSVWTAFIETTGSARVEIIEAGAIGFEKIQSAFSQARMLGASVALAYAAQGVVALASLIIVFRLWRSRASDDVKGAGLIVGAALATPYVVDYDLVILAPAIAMLVRDGLARGFGPYERTVLFFAALAPVIARPVGSGLHLSMGFLALVLLMLMIRRRALSNPVPAAPFAA